MLESVSAASLLWYRAVMVGWCLARWRYFLLGTSTFVASGIATCICNILISRRGRGTILERTSVKTESFMKDVPSIKSFANGSLICDQTASNCLKMMHIYS